MDRPAERLPDPDPVIATLMHRDVVRVDLDASVDELRALFAREGLSWAPVVDAEGAVIGVVSATDLNGPRIDAHACATLHAWQFCTYRPLAVRPETSARAVAREMADRGLHHVVVADERGMLGVVSSLDFTRAYADANGAGR